MQGANDAPQPVGSISNQQDDDSTPVLLDVSGFFGDADASDTLSFSDGGTLPPGLSLDPVTGVISGTLDSSASAGGPYSVTITADDGHGGQATQTFTWVVNNPVPDALDDSYTAGEDAAPTVVGNAVTDNDTDVDGDLLTAVPQTDVAGSNGGRFTLATDGTVTFDPHGDFEDLAVGEVRTTTLVYVVTDADGATDTATISVTVQGANDAPQPVGSISNQQDDDSTSVLLDVSGFFGDADASDTLSFSDGGTLPPGLSLDPVTGVISGMSTASASAGGPYTVTITATRPRRQDDAPLPGGGTIRSPALDERYTAGEDVRRRRQRGDRQRYRRRWRPADRGAADQRRRFERRTVHAGDRWDGDVRSACRLRRSGGRGGHTTTLVYVLTVDVDGRDRHGDDLGHGAGPTTRRSRSAASATSRATTARRCCWT
ncbi:MAG: putative Ig domain-containing protein [Pirellulales bacterium]